MKSGNAAVMLIAAGITFYVKPGVIFSSLVRTESYAGDSAGLFPA